MRDLLVSLIVLGALPLCYRRPFVGLLMFSVLAYMRLQDLAWGFARFQRWSLLVALVMVAGYVADRNKKPPVFDLRTGIMIFLAAWIGLGLLFAKGDFPVDYAGYVEYAKIVFIALFTTAVVRTREQLRILVWAIAMSFAFFGVKDGLHGIAKGGSLYIMRGPGGMLEDNNDFALAMAMAVPLLVHLATSERNPILTRGLKAMVPLSALTVMFTRSRGGTLSLGLALSILVWRSKNRLMGVMIAGFLVCAGLMLAPSGYFDRLSTLKNVEEDGSAMGRIRAWKVAGRMIEANPLFGVGFQRFQGNYLNYEPEQIAHLVEGKPLVAHNSYLQIWAECGTPAFLAYMALMGLSFWDIFRLRAEAKRRYFSSWILSYCTMFEAVLATFMLGSMFLNRAHFDLIYHYHAIVLVFGRVARQEMTDEVRYPVRPVGTGRRGGPLVRVRERGFGAGPNGGMAGGFRNTSLGSARGGA